jgi:flavin-dependent dehydrogenase
MIDPLSSLTMSTNSPANQTDFDVLIAGGGPAGSTAAIVLARAGLRVCILEKDRHPRFHIGESILPRNTPLLRALGLESRIRALAHISKFGAEFGFANDPATRRFTFNDGLLPGFPVFNIERALLDKLLLDIARESGVTVHEANPVRTIDELADGRVRVTASDARSYSARLLLDCSGHGTIVGRHLGTRKGFDEPELQKVAYFQHFEGVEHLPGDEHGHPGIFMADEGWFWLIALSKAKTSVGFVTRPGFVRTLDVAPTSLLQWAVARAPVVRQRMRHATGPATNHVLADFSYRCRPCAGPGYMLVGDAGAFLDPIFSTGVTLAMMAGHQAATIAAAQLAGTLSPRAAQARYARFIEGTTRPFWSLIRNYYKHEFRELFLHGTGPMQVHKAVISLLAGQVFPRPVWPLRWRHTLFNVFVQAQKYVALVPRRARFSLQSQQPEPLALTLTPPPHSPHPTAQPTTPAQPKTLLAAG